MPAKALQIAQRFQSTFPVWGTTYQYQQCYYYRFHFNPRSPCGERHITVPDTCISCSFQSTFPVWGTTQINFLRISDFTEFQSTFPVWGTTIIAHLMRHRRRFQSTFPVWGTTPIRHKKIISVKIFQSTFPVWGTTVSDHRYYLDQTDFNPRSPCGERRI